MFASWRNSESVIFKMSGMNIYYRKTPSYLRLFFYFQWYILIFVLETSLSKYNKLKLWSSISSLLQAFTLSLRAALPRVLISLEHVEIACRKFHERRSIYELMFYRPSQENTGDREHLLTAIEQPHGATYRETGTLRKRCFRKELAKLLWIIYKVYWKDTLL